MQNKNWIHDAIKLYQNEYKSIEEISGLLNISSAKIYYNIKNKIKLRSRREAISRHFSPEEVKEIIANYNDNKSLDFIINKFNSSSKTIKKVLTNNNIRIKKTSEYHIKYSRNNDFFKNTENWEQKHAYFLGWLMSDGHHNVKAHCIQIRLQEKDKRILEILKDIIGYDGPLHYMKRTTINEFIKRYAKKWQNRWSLVVNSQEITNDLLKLSIDNNKTNNLEFPKYLRNDLIPHFLRAFYEGDGTVSYSMYQNGKTIKFAVNVIGTKSFVYYLKDLLKEKIGVDTTQILDDGRMQNGNVVLRLAGKLNALKFFNYVYENADYVLKRKFKKFLRLINHIKRDFKKEKKPQGWKELQPELEKAIQIAKNIIQTAEY